MRESPQKYPAYLCTEPKMLTRKCMVSLSYEQILEISNIFFYVNKYLTSLPKWLGGLKFSAPVRAIHKSIHDATINCAISLEEAHRFETEGGKIDN